MTLSEKWIDIAKGIDRVGRYAFVEYDDDFIVFDIIQGNRPIAVFRGKLWAEAFTEWLNTPDNKSHVGHLRNNDVD